MSTDRPEEPWPGATYKGFAGGPPPDPLRLERDEDWVPARSPRLGRGVILGGVAAALAIGALLGLLAQPDLIGEREAPMRPVAAPAQPAVPVEVAQATPAQPPPAPAGKLEVLPPDMARQAQAPPREAPPPARTEAAPAPEGSPAAAEVEERPPPPAAERFTEAPPNPSFNCAYAGSLAERMVCGDRELARLDRRLERAFRRAVAAGAPYRLLRAEQDDWLAIREDAARESPEAVEAVYRQRIAELNAIAEDEISRSSP